MFRFGVAILALFPALAPAQIHPHFGVEIGTPLTDTLSSSGFATFSGAAMTVQQTQAHTRRLLIGPTFRVDLPHGLGIEFDALYQRLSYDSYSAFSPPLQYTFTQAAANRWQFPVLMQYSRKIWKIRPFAEVGPSIQHVTGAHEKFTSVTSQTSITSVGVATTAPVTTTNSFNGQGSTSAGITTGGGIDVPLRRIHLRPEFRYSRWFAPAATGTLAIGNVLALYPVAPVSYFGPAPTAASIRQNEASFLLGFTF